MVTSRFTLVSDSPTRLERNTGHPPFSFISIYKKSLDRSRDVPRRICDYVICYFCLFFFLLFSSFSLDFDLKRRKRIRSRDIPRRKMGNIILMTWLTTWNIRWRFVSPFLPQNWPRLSQFGKNEPISRFKPKSRDLPRRSGSQMPMWSCLMTSSAGEGILAAFLPISAGLLPVVSASRRDGTSQDF